MKNDELKDAVPCRQTVGEILNPMGYRLRRAVRTILKNKSPRQMPSSPTSMLAAKPHVRTAKG